MKILLTALLAGCIPMSASVLFTDLGTGSNVYDHNNGSVVKGSGSGGPSITQARPFTVTGTGDFLLSQVDLGLVTQIGVPTFNVSVWTNSSGQPGTELGDWNV